MSRKRALSIPQAVAAPYKQEYVLGFAFSDDLRRVALIQKERPEWQQDRLNGVGGKLEQGESPATAMVRETKEETGADTKPDQWRHFVTIEGTTCRVFCFAAINDEIINGMRTTETELLIVANPRAIPPAALPNLHWLIPLALDPEQKRPVTIDYL
jgi:8-oxo-dGTP diphosphatase